MLHVQITTHLPDKTCAQTTTKNTHTLTHTHTHAHDKQYAPESSDAICFHKVVTATMYLTTTRGFNFTNFIFAVQYTNIHENTHTYVHTRTHVRTHTTSSSRKNFTTCTLPLMSAYTHTYTRAQGIAMGYRKRRTSECFVDVFQSSPSWRREFRNASEAGIVILSVLNRLLFVGEWTLKVNWAHHL